MPLVKRYPVVRIRRNFQHREYGLIAVYSTKEEAELHSDIRRCTSCGAEAFRITRCGEGYQVWKYQKDKVKRKR